MKDEPFNPAPGDASDQDKAHTPDTLQRDVRRKGHDMPEQNDTVSPDDYERPSADPTHPAGTVERGR